jgi:hypothetical protein
MGRSRIDRRGVATPFLGLSPAAALRWRVALGWLCSMQTAQAAEIFGPCHGAAVVVANVES